MTERITNERIVTPYPHTGRKADASASVTSSPVELGDIRTKQLSTTSTHTEGQSPWLIDFLNPQPHRAGHFGAARGIPTGPVPLERLIIPELAERLIEEFTPKPMDTPAPRPAKESLLLVEPSQSTDLFEPAAPKEVSLETEEARIWKEVLGTNFYVPDAPRWLKNDAFQESLAKDNLQLLFIPSILFGQRPFLQQKGLRGYLEALQEKYPAWEHYEALPPEQKKDPGFSRKFNMWYWQQIANGTIAIPQGEGWTGKTDGQWAVIETIQKPDEWSEYNDSTISEMLGFRTGRCDNSYLDLNNSIKTNKDRILQHYGFSRFANGEVSFGLLPAHVWNLVANRDDAGWAISTGREFTETMYNHHGQNIPLVVGDSRKGCAADIDAVDPFRPYSGIGFRTGFFINQAA